jgi:hypothetical protein
MSNLEADRLKFEECKNKQYNKPSPEEGGSFAAQMMDALNIKTCERTYSKKESETEYWVQFGLLPRTGITTRETQENSSVIGCEQLDVIAERNYENSQRIKCILEQTSSEITTIAMAVNTIQLSAGKDLLIECPEGFNLDQKAEVKVYASNNYSESQVESIQDVVLENITQNLFTLQESPYGFASTPDGRKYIEETLNKVERGEFNTEIKQTLLSITNNVTASNKVIIESGGNLKINGKRCTISQEAIIDIIATNMINSTMEKVFKNYTEKSIEYVKEEKIKNSQLLTEKSKSTSILTYLGIILTIIIIIVIIIIIYKKKQEQNQTMNLQGYQTLQQQY